MLSSISMVSKVSAEDLLAFSEAELVECMKANRGPGGFRLAVDKGWGSLSKNGRDELAERLK